MQFKTKKELWLFITGEAKKQGYKRAALRMGARCLYRQKTDTGTFKCNIGHLIPDERYSPTMEGLTAEEVCKHVLNWRDPELIKMAGELQEIHDEEAVTAQEHRHRLLDYGRKNNLPTEHIGDCWLKGMA